MKLVAAHTPLRARCPRSGLEEPKIDTHLGITICRTAQAGSAGSPPPTSVTLSDHLAALKSGAPRSYAKSSAQRRAIIYARAKL